MGSRLIFFASFAVVLQCLHCQDYGDYQYPGNQETTTPIPDYFDTSIATLTPTLDNLLSLPGKLSTLRRSPVTFNTVDQLLPMFNLLQTLDRQVLEENHATTANIREALAAILTDIAIATPKGGSRIAKDLAIVIKDSSKPSGKPYWAMAGEIVFKNPNFQIEEFGLATKERHSVFVVYNRNVSPFKPLPLVPFLLDFQVVDLVSVDTGKRSGKSLQGPLQMITLRATTKQVRHNTKYACAFWHDARDAWTSEGCFVFSDTPLEATCRCHASQGTYFLVYSFHDFDDDIVNFTNVNVETDLSRAADLDAYLAKVTESAKVGERPSALGDLVTHLWTVFQFFPSLYANSSAAAILHAIGATLSKVIPFEETGVLGRGDSRITAFVVRLDLFQGDPPIGFAFYRDDSLWMEYQRSQDLNTNRLFANHFAFAFHFSASVIGQNSRYAFLVYPADVDLHPPPSLNGGRSVVASRVVDLVMTSKPGGKKEDELVVMHFLPDDTRAGNDFRCASWSDVTQAWDTAVCVTSVQLFRRSECACNLTAVTGERKQLMMMEYSPIQFYQVRDFQKEADVEDWQLRESTVFALCTLPPLPDNADNLEVMLKLLNKAVVLSDNIPIIWEAKTVRAMTRNVHDALKTATHSLKYFPSDEVGYIIQASNNGTKTSLGDTFAVQRGALMYVKSVDDEGAFAFTDFGVNISPNVEVLYDYRGFLVYPLNIFPGQLPRLGPNLQISTFRVVDVVLATNKTSTSLNKNYVEMHLGADGGKLGCAFWGDSAEDWTREGCGTVADLGVRVCRCNFGAPKNGGLFAAFNYDAVAGEEDILEKPDASKNEIQVNILKNDTQILSDATLFFENPSSSTPSIKSLMTHLTVVDSVLSLNAELLSKNEDCFQLINKATWSLLDKYYINSNWPVMHSLVVPSNGTLKSSNLFTDLYSSTYTQGDKSAKGQVVPSNYTMVAFGFYQKTQGVPNGFYFKPETGETVQYLHDDDLIRYFQSKSFAVQLMNPNCLRSLRVVFVVYPLNKASFPPDNLSRKVVFNARAVDIHIKKGNRVVPQQQPDAQEYGYDEAEPDRPTSQFEAGVDIFSQVAFNPKRYVRIGCSVWMDKSSSLPFSTWSSDMFPNSICTVYQSDRNAMCRCKLDGRVATKVIVFEYADLPNFASKTDYDTKSSMFIVSSFFSIMGIAFIALTALFYPEWRHSFGNKVFINLTAATFFYLVVTMYRETNVIYFDPDDRGKLVALSVLVHYTRLVHYDWMAVVSIQQWQGADWSGLEQTDAKSLLRRIMIVAWGLPVLPLIVTLSWNVKEHLVTPDKTMHYLLFIGPGILITVINILLLVAITVRMARFWYLWKKEFGKIGMSDRTMMLMQLKSLVQMFFLFGIPTSFEIFNSFGAKNAVLDFLFKVTDPLQGFMLFVFFICLDKGTRKLWMSCDSGSLIRLDLEFPEEEVNHFDRASQRTTTSTTAWGGNSWTL